MKRKTKFKILRILFVISLIISLYMISDIYAKYQEQVNTSYQSSVKRWKVKVNDEIVRQNTSLKEIITPNLTGNQYIKDNVIVPGREGYFEFDVDYSQVDVPFTFDFSLNQSTQLLDFEYYAYVINDGVTYNNVTLYNLPEGYKQVEYIESTGTQYIQTGFIPNQDTRVVIDYQLAEVNNGFLFGTRTLSEDNVYAISINNNNILSNYKTEAIVNNANTQRHIIDKNKNKVYFDGDLKLTHEGAKLALTDPLELFAIKNGSTSGYMTSKTKIYSIKIYDNEVLTREFVPCYKETVDGTYEKAGLYDLITNSFFNNKGTGDFKIPRDIENNPIDINIKSIILNKDEDTQNETNIKAYIRWNDSTENQMDNTEDTAFVIEPNNNDVEYEATLKFEQYIEE